MVDLSLVVPVYNEGENIGRFLDEMAAKVKTPFEALFVYDFDEDNTLPVLDQARKMLPIRAVKNRLGGGVLNALKTGFSAAKGRFVVVTMADCSDDLADVDRLVARAREGYDLVAASRYVGGGKQVGGPRLKRALSRLAGLSLHYLSGIPIRDATNNFRLYRKTLLEKIEIESQGGFELALELTVKAHCAGFRVTEIPTIWTDRTAGESRFRLGRWLPRYLQWYFYGLSRSKQCPIQANYEQPD
jgi:dolichol-phosphate mannosyltransferase